MNGTMVYFLLYILKIRNKYQEIFYDWLDDRDSKRYQIITWFLYTSISSINLQGDPHEYRKKGMRFII